MARQFVEQRTRTSIRNIESSFPSIKFSISAAENAQKNLDVVQDKYRQGIEFITRLLEAQSTSFIADQNAAASTYTFLIDLLNFQRAISWFEVEKSAEEKAELVRMIKAAINGE